MSEGPENCPVLMREIQTLGYEGGYTTVADYAWPRRRVRQRQATLRFETGPGERAHVDWCSFSYLGDDGRQHRVWAFVMVLSWFRSIYVEFVRRADVASFIQCHINAIEYFGGVPRRCLYDNAKVVILGRDQEGHTEWNRGMLDFSLRVGFEMRVYQPHPGPDQGESRKRCEVRAGQHVAQPLLRRRCRPEREVPGVVRQRRQPEDSRHHGTTGRRPRDMLAEELAHLGPLPDRVGFAPCLREDRKVSRDGYVHREGVRYGVHWK